MTHSSFSDFGLADPILLALAGRKHTIPTPIQVQAIPELLLGKDVLGIAQTGTGKTGAFALPILQRLAENSQATGQQPADRRPPERRPPDRRPKGRGNRNGRNGRHGPAAPGPRALVLAPTRELAMQIGTEFTAYASHMKIQHTVIFGGVGQRPQVAALLRGVDIVVATPGRLLDLMSQGYVDLSTTEYLVLDEADRMLDMGFVRDVRKIVGALPARRQSLLFSATMPRGVSTLCQEILTDPVTIEVAPQATPIERITQSVYHVGSADKSALLAEILNDPDMSRVIVFARTKHRVNRVATQLAKQGVSSEALHGNKSQSARQRALKRFRAGQARVLVATDIAARGLDIDDVSHVIIFELPNEPESYVHRIGRTARAGAHGIALSFCDIHERSYLTSIERLIHCDLTVIGDAPAPTRSKAKKKSAPHSKRNGSQKAAQKTERSAKGANFNQKRRRRRPNQNFSKVPAAA